MPQPDRIQSAATAEVERLRVERCFRLPFGYRVTVRRLVVPTRWFVDVQIGFRGRYISVERP